MLHVDQDSPIMAAQPLKVASTYLGISVIMLLVSAVFAVVFARDLLHAHRIGQSNSWQTFLLGILFGFTLLSGSTYSLVRAWQNYSIVSRLELDGQSARGTITNRWVDTFEGQPFYRVSYRFREDVEIWETIPEDLFEILLEGSHVPVRFLQHDPYVSRLDYERISPG